MNATQTKTLEIAEIVKTIGLTCKVSTKNDMAECFKLQNDPILSNIYAEQYYATCSKSDIMKIDLQRRIYIHELIEKEISKSKRTLSIYDVFFRVLTALLERNLFITGEVNEYVAYEAAEGGYPIHRDTPLYFVAFSQVNYTMIGNFFELKEACKEYFGEAIDKEYTTKDQLDFSSGYDFVRFMLEQFFERVIELTGNEDGKTFKQSQEANYLEPDDETGGYIDHVKWSYNFDQPAQFEPYLGYC